MYLYNTGHRECPSPSYGKVKKQANNIICRIASNDQCMAVCVCVCLDDGNLGMERMWGWGARVAVHVHILYVV
jgi:hypothetical protein